MMSIVTRPRLVWAFAAASFIAADVHCGRCGGAVVVGGLEPCERGPMTVVATRLRSVPALAAALSIVAGTVRRRGGAVFARYREALSAAGLVPRAVSTVGDLVVPWSRMAWNHREAPRTADLAPSGMSAVDDLVRLGSWMAWDRAGGGR
jgi:hypothetical protein